MTGPRDWDKELANIDKVIASSGAIPQTDASSRSAPARQEGPSGSMLDSSRPSGSPATLRRHIATTWFWAFLGAFGAVALLYWPYNKSCGGPLYLYLTGVLAVVAAGVSAMRSAWTHRRGVAHMLGLFVLLAGLALAATEILPRIGYAAVARTWTCP